jgi:membrane-associated protease RseP (regulator of RpoE activity)
MFIVVAGCAHRDHRSQLITQIKAHGGEFYAKTATPSDISLLLIPADWQGGDRGIDNVEGYCASTDHPPAILFVGSGVSQKRIAQLELALPAVSTRQVSDVGIGIITRRADNERFVKIIEVIPKSSASRAGLSVGDIITQIDGRPVTTFESLLTALIPKRPNEKSTITVDRSGVIADLQITWEANTHIKKDQLTMR